MLLMVPEPRETPATEHSRQLRFWILRELCERSCAVPVYYAIGNSRWNSRFVKGQSPPLPAISCCRRSYTDCRCTMDATRCTMNATRWVLNWASSLWQLPTWPPCTPTGCCTLLPTTVQLNGLCDGFQLNVADMTTPQHTGVLEWEQTFPTFQQDTVFLTLFFDTFLRHCMFFYDTVFYGTVFMALFLDIASTLLPARSSIYTVHFYNLYNNMGHFDEALGQR